MPDMTCVATPESPCALGRGDMSMPKMTSVFSKASDKLVRYYKKVRYARFVPFYILIWAAFGAGVARLLASSMRQSAKGKLAVVVCCNVICRQFLLAGDTCLLSMDLPMMLSVPWPHCNDNLSHAAGAFVGGYLHNYTLPTEKVTGVTFPLAKAFAQVIQVRTGLP